LTCESNRAIGRKKGENIEWAKKSDVEAQKRGIVGGKNTLNFMEYVQGGLKELPWFQQ